MATFVRNIELHNLYLEKVVSLIEDLSRLSVFKYTPLIRLFEELIEMRARITHFPYERGELLTDYCCNPEVYWLTISIFQEAVYYHLMSWNTFLFTQPESYWNHYFKIDEAAVRIKELLELFIKIFEPI